VFPKMSVDFFISTNQNEFDFDAIHCFLSDTYWSKGIPKATLSKAINNSLCFSVLSKEGEQIGFARMITDKATFGYLADVFIIPEYRGHGLSKALMEAIVEHPELQGLRRMVLATKDAHGLYQQFGFKAIAQPDLFMEIWQPDVYSVNY
jgi:N-acetylglutamate synthase-like GNAT family acetyltransferase